MISAHPTTERAPNQRELTPWGSLLVNTARGRPPRNGLKIDLGAGPTAAIAQALGGEGWLAIEPHYETVSDSSITFVKGTLSHLTTLADFVLFNPPAIKSDLLDPCHPDRRLFDGGLDGLTAITESLAAAASRLSPQGEIVIVIPSFHPPPPYVLNSSLQLSRLPSWESENIEVFSERVPAARGMEQSLKNWLTTRGHRFATRWSHWGIAPPRAHFAITVWSAKPLDARNATRTDRP